MVGPYFLIKKEEWRFKSNDAEFQPSIIFSNAILESETNVYPQILKICSSYWSESVIDTRPSTTPCDELKLRLVFEISQLLVGVRSNPSGFGVFSEGTYLSFKDFEKSCLVFEKSDFEILLICIDPQNWCRVQPESPNWPQKRYV